MITESHLVIAAFVKRVIWKIKYRLFVKNVIIDALLAALM